MARAAFAAAAFAAALLVVQSATAVELTPLGPGKQVLTTLISAPGPSENSLNLTAGYRTLAVFATGVTGTLSAELQVSCNGGATWFNYPGAASVTALPGIITVSNPVPCSYRLNASTCTGCLLVASAFPSGRSLGGCN